MNVLVRLFFCFYALAVTGLAAVFAAVSLHRVPESRLYSFFHTLYESKQWTGIALTVSLTLLVASIWLMFNLLRSPSRPRAVEQVNEHGEIRISINTVESLARKATMRIRGITDLKSKVTVSESGLSVFLKVTVDGEGPIPELTERLQTSVKEHVETIAGVDVVNVSVSVEDIHPPHSQKHARRVV